MSEKLQSNQFKKFLQTGSENFSDDEKLEVATACIMSFVQDNFTGPDIKKTFEINFDQERWKIERISANGIEFNENFKNLSLLIIARNFLDDLLTKHPNDLVSF